MRDYEEKSYYEIQLDNKQLILVFLAGVTVCVLIFILGVMVGKGKKETEMALAGRTDEAPAAKSPGPETKAPKEPAVITDEDEKSPKKDRKDKGDKAAKQEKTETGDKKGDDYSFYDLDKPDSNKSDLTKKDSSAQKPSDNKTATPVAKTQPVETQPPAVTPAPVEDAASTPADVGAEGHLFTVQVMATASKPKADEQLNHLKSKGYTAFVSEEKAGSSTVYKVRVGKFKDSDAAKKLATRLKDDLKLETWVAVLD